MLLAVNALNRVLDRETKIKPWVEMELVVDAKDSGNKGLPVR